MSTKTMPPHAEPGVNSDLVAPPLRGREFSGSHACRLTLPKPCGKPAPCGMDCDLKLGPERHALLELGQMARLAVMIEPATRGKFANQARELFAQLYCIVRRHWPAVMPTTMMVFLANEADEEACRWIIAEVFGAGAPVTTFVAQPPCGGAALAVELWAVGGETVNVTRHGAYLVEVESDGIRWIHCGGIRGPLWADGPYDESLSCFQAMEQQLGRAGVGFDQVLRTWIYINQITEGPEGKRRYQEMNRARTAFFRDRQLCGRNRAPTAPATVYPASTGIGTQARAITMCCMALDSDRPDVFVLPLENPQQTPACDYATIYSPQSPKFSRAIAVVQGPFVTTLVSGTASIVDQETVHTGDAAGQTEQTIGNIAKLVAPENFAHHGLPGGGATLRDIAKLRVYVKRTEDFPACREVVERLLPGVPVLYLHADVCRPDLLVEIEAVTFSPFHGPVPPRARVTNH